MEQFTWCTFSLLPYLADRRQHPALRSSMWQWKTTHCHSRLK